MKKRKPSAAQPIDPDRLQARILSSPTAQPRAARPVEEPPMAPATEQLPGNERRRRDDRMAALINHQRNSTPPSGPIT